MIYGHFGLRISANVPRLYDCFIFACDKYEVYGVLMCMITNVFLRKAR